MRTAVEIIESFPGTPDSLIPLLQQLQSEFGWLSEETMKEVSAALGIPLHRVYSVATFYNVFSLKPKGRNSVRVCMGTACHVRGAAGVLVEVERCLGIQSGETSTDGRFSLETVNCLGACALGPIMVVNSEYKGNLTPSGVSELISGYAGKEKP